METLHTFSTIAMPDRKKKKCTQKNQKTLIYYLVYSYRIKGISFPTRNEEKNRFKIQRQNPIKPPEHLCYQSSWEILLFVLMDDGVWIACLNIFPHEQGVFLPLPGESPLCLCSYFMWEQPRAVGAPGLLWVDPSAWRRGSGSSAREPRPLLYMSLAHPGVH